jgi:hypothetical protein
VATFASIRSANQSARIAERAARAAERTRSHPPLDEFAGQRRDIYVPPGVLYGDFEGGQRVISQFILRHQGEQCLVSAGRHFQLDQPDPREGE